MCEMLLRVQNNTDTDPLVNLKSWKRGMVIVVEPDGWPWGIEELNNPTFVVLKIPDMTVLEASVFLGNLIPSTGKDITNPLRQFFIDVDDPTVSSNVTPPGSSVRPKQTVTITKAQVNLLKKSVVIVAV